MQCTEHGDFGPNKEAFVYTHGCQDCATATSLVDIPYDSFRWEIYPNPVADWLIINYWLEERTRIAFTLYNVLGQAMPENNAPVEEGTGWHQSRIGMHSLPKGGYYLVANIGGRQAVKKLSVW